MRSLILAAGSGTRFGGKLPKVLLQVVGKSLLRRHVECLSCIGIHPGCIDVVTGFCSDLVACACDELGLNTLYNPDWRNPGNLASFITAPASNEDLLVVHGDLVWEPGLALGSIERQGDIILPLDPRTACNDEAMKASVRDGGLLRLSKNLTPEESAGESMGLFLIRRHWNVIEKSKCVRSVTEANLDDVINLTVSELEVSTWLTEQFVWEEIDTPEDLVMAERKFS